MKFDVSVITGWRYDFKIEADSIEQAGRKVEELYSEHSGELENAKELNTLSVCDHDTVITPEKGAKQLYFTSATNYYSKEISVYEIVNNVPTMLHQIDAETWREDGEDEGIVKEFFEEKGLYKDGFALTRL